MVHLVQLRSERLLAAGASVVFVARASPPPTLILLGGPWAVHVALVCPRICILR